VLVVGGPVGADGHARADHPERPARVAAAMAGVHDLALGDQLRLVAPVDVDLATLALVHDRGYLEKLAASPPGQLDADTYLTPSSWEAARRAAGAGLAAVAELERLGTGVAFVAARPPGHHALADRGMGFCLVNNVAVAAATLAARGERVLVVDWDVHHGNGTQAIFWNDPRVLYVSTHQWPLYPGTGRPQEVGGAQAPGLTLNVPLPPGTTGDVVRRAYEELAAPVVAGFGPTWVLVSAGFDGHRADPLADFALSAGDFAELARIVGHFAPAPGRVAVFLEGGYDLRALRGSVEATLGALLGARCEPELPTSGGPGMDVIETVREGYAESVDRVRALA